MKGLKTGITTEGVSQPIYGVREKKNVYVAVRDGVRLAVDIYRPDAEGKFPALLAMSPYGKELQRLKMPPQPASSPLWDGCIEAGDTEYIVSRGYTHVIADVRGTGYSEGEYCGMFSKPEAEDGYDLVEWIAKQPWCDGNVGMIGISYFGIIQLLVAAEQPPHLKAICPFQVISDLYRATYEGGVLSAFWYGLWYGCVADSGFAPKNVVSAMMKSLPKVELEHRIQEVKNNLDLKNYSFLYRLLAYPEKNPLFFDFLLNPTDGPFYWDRSAYTRFDKINIPVYTGTSWGVPFGLSGAFSIYLGVKGSKKLIMVDTPPERPFHQYHDKFMRWYDYWLKGLDTGIMDEPSIELFITGANRWRYEQEWPLASTTWTKFYLRSRGHLSIEPEPFPDIPPNSFVQEPPTVTTKPKSLQYVTAPLNEDTEVIGPAALYLYASIDGDDTNWLVALKDVGPDGSETKLTSGYLKASHRALDKSKSKPWQPFHPHLKLDPVMPGQIYEYAIEIMPIAHLFKAGHRIQIEIANMDYPPGGHCFFHVCSSKVISHKIYCDKQRQSYLLLPVIPVEGD